jgi:uncharacterized membrane protein
VVRFVVGRRRLLLSFVAGLLLFAVLPDRLYPATRFIFAWDVMTALYVSATLTMMMQSTVETCHNRAALYDEGDWVILVLVVASAAASFVAIFAELASLTGKREPLALGLVITALTVALSWTFTHVVFTLHYANVYYKPDDCTFPATVRRTIGISSTTPSSSAARRRPAMSRPSRAPCVASLWCTASWPSPSIPPSSR